MNCPNCKRRIQAAPYCMYCGQPTGAAASAAPKRKKRPNGTGSVRKISGLRKPWRATILRDGKSIHLGYFRTEKEALAALAPQNIETISSTYNYTFGQVWEAVRAEKRYLSLSAGQRTTLEGCYRNHLAADLEHRRMRELRPRHYQPILDAMSDEGLSVSLQQKAHSIISKCCTWARQNDLIQQNYAEVLYLETDDAKAKNIFTDQELRLLFAAQGNRAADIILILIGTGMRPADLARIRKDERINAAEHYMLLEGSKTRAGRNRHLYINSAVWPIFSRYYMAAEPGDYIFKSPAGKQLNLHNFREREFYPELARLGIMPNPYEDGHRTGEEPPKYTPYSCRHTFFSLANRAGVKKEILQKVGGHVPGSDITDRVYIHQNAMEFAEELDKLGSAMLALGG